MQPRSTMATPTAQALSLLWLAVSKSMAANVVIRPCASDFCVCFPGFALTQSKIGASYSDPIFFSSPHLPLKTIIAIPYNISANITTTENPKWIARIVASTALKTEAQPFTPHTQGINAGAALPNRANPNGNGIPIQKASGAIRRAEITTFTNVGNQFNMENNGPSAR